MSCHSFPKHGAELATCQATHSTYAHPNWRMSIHPCGQTEHNTRARPRATSKTKLAKTCGQHKPLTRIMPHTHETFRSHPGCGNNAMHGKHVAHSNPFPLECWNGSNETTINFISANPFEEWVGCQRLWQCICRFGCSNPSLASCLDMLCPQLH